MSLQYNHGFLLPITLQILRNDVSLQSVVFVEWIMKGHNYSATTCVHTLYGGWFSQFQPKPIKHDSMWYVDIYTSLSLNAKLHYVIVWW